MNLFRRVAVFCSAIVFLSTILAPPLFAKPGKSLTINATPIEVLLPGNPQIQQFGQLRFLGGLVLESNKKNFGGISGFRIHNQENEFLAVTDQGHWLSGTIVRNGTKPSGIEKSRIGKLRDSNGKKLKGKRHSDAEGLEVSGNEYLISFERNHRVARFAWQNDRLQQVSGLQSIDLNGYNLDNNHGPEAVAKSTQTGDIYVFPEGDQISENLYRGFVIGNSTISEIQISENEGYSLTDAQFAETGELFLLERYYFPFLGVAAKIRKFTPQELSSGTPLVGEVIFQAGWQHEIDNMEGLAISSMEDGSTRISLISDDNFSKSQRTLLLEFQLIH